MAEAAVLAYRQWRLERRMFWRNPTAAFFSFTLPLLFLFLFGAIFSGDQKTLNVIVPGILGMSVMSTTFNALAMNITFLREEGVLKRIHGTPMPPISYLGGVTANAVSNATVQIVIFISRVFYDVDTAPQFLRDVAQVLPLTHIINGVSSAMVTGESLADNLGNLAVIVAWGIFGAFFAVRGFSWQSKRNRSAPAP